MDKNLEKIRHSLAHIMAYAVQELYPGVKFGIGPAIENGFYYDFGDLKISDSDLPRVEKKMKELIKKDLKFVKRNISKAEAKKLFKDQPYKLELIEEIPKKEIIIYKNGDFIDLCKGPHIKSAEQIDSDSFKLTKIAGAYWEGSEKNPMLTRIYGLAFNNKKELDNYIQLEQEAEKRDHRKLGALLELFLIDEEMGLGLPLWLPKGALIRKTIEDYLYDELSSENYQWLYTPHIGNRKLWEKSGHWGFYSESMYPPLEVGQSLEETKKGEKAEIKEEYLIKPMNCPFHIKAYNSKIRSYKDLPLKFAELGTVYRYERSGTLHGLTRMRGFTQDDAHIICRPEQILKELEKLVKHGLKMLSDFGFKDYSICLSTKPEKHVGSDQDWIRATEALKQVLKNLKLNYETDSGGGVFYGPKIDIKIKDSIGREWQCTTIQFDFNLPERFKMSCINEKGQPEKPYMIHRALLGSMERFFGVLIEHWAGAFPLWLSPIQVWIAPISSKHQKYAEKVFSLLKKELKNLRIEIKGENETISKKIKEGEIQKIPYILVVGNKEIKNGSVAVRKRGQGDLGAMKINKFIELIAKEIESKK